MTHERVLEYPTDRHERLHGPLGYADYKSFKPWLRDEFRFRCVYCLWREVWCADGDGSFGIDHVRSRASHPEQGSDYDNLVYACGRCNSIKQDIPLPVDPCEEGWGKHLQTIPDGTVRGITALGRKTIEICRLNRPALVQARRRMRQLLQELDAGGTAESKSLLREYLSFPTNLPVLSQLHPPLEMRVQKGLPRATTNGESAVSCRRPTDHHPPGKNAPQLCLGFMICPLGPVSTAQAFP